MPYRWKKAASNSQRSRKRRASSQRNGGPLHPQSRANASKSDAVQVSSSTRGNSHACNVCCWPAHAHGWQNIPAFAGDDNMQTILPSEFKRQMVLMLDGSPHVVEDMHTSGTAQTRHRLHTRLRQLTTGRLTDFSSMFMAISSHALHASSRPVWAQ
jgi:hypothetical protein